jgi:hypothetical protein
MINPSEHLCGERAVNTRRRSLFLRFAAAVLCILVLCAFVPVTTGAQATSQKAPNANSLPYRNIAPGVRFVGSEVCGSCHNDIFNKFRKTEMGRSMIAGNESSFVASLPLPAKVYDKDTGQYFEVLRKDGHLYQSQYALDDDGKELSRQTWKIDYVIGAGANGFGFLIHRGGHLFEAPLT